MYKNMYMYMYMDMQYADVYAYAYVHGYVYAYVYVFIGKAGTIQNPDTRYRDRVSKSLTFVGTLAFKICGGSKSVPT